MANDEGAVAPAGTGEDAGPNVIPEDESGSLLKELRILPPLQKKDTLTRDESLDAISLPPIRAEEPVSSLRAALGEVCGYAHLTSFRFVLEESKPSSKNKTQSSDTEAAPLVSPYTGPNAVVSVPVAVKSLDVEPLQKGNMVEPDDVPVVLDDYDDLKPLLDKGLESGSGFRIVLEKYDAAGVRDQVTRVRYLFDGNAPVVTSLDGVDAPASTKEDDSDDAESKAKEDSDTTKETSAKTEENKIEDISLNRPVAFDSSNLQDFYYLACGEEESLYEDEEFSKPNGDKSSGQAKQPKKKKSKGKKKGGDKSDEDESTEIAAGESLRTTIRNLNELEEKTRVKCVIRYSGFHPPPPSRRLMGDLCYLEVTPPDYPDQPILNITAVPTGFYVNRSTIVNGVHKFDPSPAAKPCFSHELLDCLLQASPSVRSAWETALIASKERAEVTASSSRENALFALHRVAVRGNYGGFQNSFTASASQGIDSIVFRPSWLVPVPRDIDGNDAWSHNSLHEYSPSRTEADISNSFGLDIRSGAVRDWNEELQSAREMPVSNLQERIDRARMIHKVLNDFGEAAVVGALAIYDGHVAAMNPNEPTRSHVYLHNNIFFSRAVDSGVETFKIATGDRSARKSASRDAQCMGALHRLDVKGLHTLATVLVDYLGTRFICQSIVPGILHGDKTHTLLYGAVEATSPLVWDKDMHEILEESIGKTFMIATRTMPTKPLTDKRLAEIEELRTVAPFPLENEKSKVVEVLSPTTTVCGPVEAKGIRGSDQRKYVLDLTRLSPRDANWIPKSDGGTGKWEAVLEENGAASKQQYVPGTLEDDEWTMAVLRPELVTSLTHKKMSEYLSSKADSEEQSQKADADKETSTPEGSEQKVTSSEDSEGLAADDKAAKESASGDDKPKPSKRKLTPEDEDHLRSLRLNVNLFLPNMRSLEGLDDAAGAQLEADVERVRESALYLWDTLLPKLTQEMRLGSGQQLPVDGQSLTELLHQRGINCRYLGRLAALAAAEEDSDRQAVKKVESGQAAALPRRIMPLCWLEMLECEMVARASKHVLDSYLTEHGGTAAAQPAQTLSSFLSALVSTSEESAGDTETRLRKEEVASGTSLPDEEDFNALSIIDTGGSGDAVPNPIRDRKQVWEDIEREVGRRFRYTLSLYNRRESSDRALFAPLLRRVCQRTGIRLAAKAYALGGKGLCSAGSTYGGRITASYPISPLDIIEVVPLVKHAAAQGGEGFVPCSLGSSVMLPSLYILLPDAKGTLESAHLHYSARALPRALDLAQEAASLYQRVTDTPMHLSILRCLDLTSAILFEAGETQLAAGNAGRALALSVQLGGFDCPEAVSGHSTLSHILLSSGNVSGGIKHLRAAAYLMELMAGRHYAELSNAYHKLGSLYHELQKPQTAYRCYVEASDHHISDRFFEGMIARSTALALASLGQFKEAVEYEKKAYMCYVRLLGEDHEMTKNSAKALQNFTRLAVEVGSRKREEENIRKEEEAANAVASAIEAEVEEEEKKKNRVKKKKKK